MKIKPEHIKNMLLIAGGVLAFLVLRKKLKAWGLIGDGGKKAQSEIAQMLAEDESVQVIAAATITEVEADRIAKDIRNAWGVLNDDEEAVYSSLQKLHTLADLLLVIEKYGFYQPNILIQAEDLPTSIQSRMSKKERAKCNEILKAKGINFEF